MRIHTFEVPGPLPLLDHDPEIVWISPGHALAGFGVAARIEPGTGPDRFNRAEQAFTGWLGGQQLVDDFPGGGPIAVGSFTFDASSSGSTLVVPRVTLGRRGDCWWVTTVDGADHHPLLHPAGTSDRPTDRPRYAGSSMPDVLWLDAVASALAEIEAGRLDKVVLARDYAVWSRVPFDRRRLLRRLSERFPECFTFLVEGLVGASPELLVRKHGMAIESVVLAGSSRRSPDPAEDEQLGKALLASEKDHREHEPAADSVRRVLADTCSRLESNQEPELVTLANVMHLATRFSGRLAGHYSALELVKRLHPTAAVGGQPTHTALDLIKALEGMDRGRYAGPVGWTDRRGDGEWAIALRCAELSGARARLFAGAGLVAGSLPEDELEETRVKLLAMQEALGG
jgi:menaquinone-specific isochorismate synthase